MNGREVQLWRGLEGFPNKLLPGQPALERARGEHHRDRRQRTSKVVWRLGPDYRGDGALERLG